MGNCTCGSDAQVINKIGEQPLPWSILPVSLPPSLQDIDKLAARLCEIVRAAGAVELEIYNNSFKDVDVQMKKDEFGNVSPVTNADQEATKVICRMLNDLDENIPIVIEENELEPYEKRKKYKYFWCCDPLDGTKEFLKKNGQFTVNIGLIHKDITIFGAVYVPVQDILYYGGTLGNFGAWKQTSAGAKPQRIQVATFSRTDENLTIVASASHNNQPTQDFINKFNNPKVKSMGSSLKLLLVAEGEAHCYPRLAPTCEWDTSAAHAIVSAAGGSVLIADVIFERYTDGKPQGLIKNPNGGQLVRYNKESVLNPYFVVWGKLKE